MNNNNQSQDNLVSHLSRVFIENRHSAVKNKDYSVLILVWLLPSGKTYHQEQFLTNEQKSIIEMTASQPSSL